MAIELMTYTSLALTAEDSKTGSFSLDTRVKEICRISLPDCELIEDPTEFITKYKMRLEQEQQDFEHVPLDLMQWGEYDVDQISEPTMNGKELTFYVKNQDQIPFKVTAAPSNPVVCGLLPLKY